MLQCYTDMTSYAFCLISMLCIVFLNLRTLNLQFIGSFDLKMMLLGLKEDTAVTPVYSD